MEDFKVYDEENECWIDETKCIYKNGNLYRDDKAYINMVSDDLTVFEAVKGLEAFGEKIFIDSSKVQFNWIDSTEKVHTSWGVFKYDDSLLIPDKEQKSDIVALSCSSAIAATRPILVVKETF